MQIVFWIILGLLLYNYGGYFLLLRVLAPIVRRLRKPHRVDDDNRPMVSMVISLHNEEQCIAQRIDNFEALDYPKDKLELLLGDDCSNDRTRAIIREHMARNPRVRLVEFDSHQGKVAVINQLVQQACGDVLAFSDGDTFWKPDALRLLVRHLADKTIGAACGRITLKSPTGQNPDDQYLQFETQIKLAENDLGVVLGASGGIYILRKNVFQPLASNVIQVDDFVWPLRVYEKGYCSVYEPAAIAHGEAAPTVEAEFHRKIRVSAGAYRALVECRRLLAPWKGWIAFAFWSHKVLRWATPFFLIVLFVANAVLVQRPLYRILLTGQIAFYVCAALGWLMSHQRHLLATMFRLPYYFVASNLAMLIGFFKCITGQQKATWSGKSHRVETDPRIRNGHI